MKTTTEMLSRRKLLQLCVGASLLMNTKSGFAMNAPDSQKSPLQAAGRELLEKVIKEFWIPEKHLFANDLKLDKPDDKNPAFMWGCGVMLTALSAAAKVDPAKYRSLAEDYSKALQIYWLESGEIGGYDVLPTPKPPDRYFDDNEWMALAHYEIYENFKSPIELERAQKTLAYALSGEDTKLGGGIYWRESDRKDKNTCSNGPAVAACLRDYMLTRNKSSLETAKRIFKWTCENLQDKDGLFFDGLKLDGELGKTKWTYNTALMLRSYCLFYRITKEIHYLEDALRIAKASEQQWLDPKTAIAKNPSCFSHLLYEAFLELSSVSKDAHWRELVVKGLISLRDLERDDNGWYSESWGEHKSDSHTKIELISQASAIRAFFYTSLYL